MQIRIYSLISFIIITLTVYALFAIKDKVIALNYQLKEVINQINFERDNIYTLKAEKAYLTSPARLSKLAKTYLDLENIKITQMIKDPLVAKENNEKGEPIITAANSKDKTNLPKWRYKRSANKYLQTAAHNRK